MSPGVGAAAQRLRVDYATAEVLRAYRAAGVRSILLKGASLVNWLYEPREGRTYLDCDLLVPAGDFEAACAVLAARGFVPELDEAEMPDWWREHGLTWFRADDSAAVDLHRTVEGVGVESDLVWAALSLRTERGEVGGFEAVVLTVPARALLVALHAAQHGGKPRHLQELERALERVDDADWREAAQLAEELDASPALATGLRLLRGGAVLADRLGLPNARPVDVALRAEGSTPALTVELFSRAAGSARIAMVWHKLAPPPTFMRKWSPLARKGRLGLALAYLWRPLWVLVTTPRAVRAWRAARKAARGR